MRWNRYHETRLRCGPNLGDDGQDGSLSPEKFKLKGFVKHRLPAYLSLNEMRVQVAPEPRAFADSTTTYRTAHYRGMLSPLVHFHIKTQHDRGYLLFLLACILFRACQSFDWPAASWVHEFRVPCARVTRQERFHCEQRLISKTSYGVLKGLCTIPD